MAYIEELRGGLNAEQTPYFSMSTTLGKEFNC